ncbi:MAG: NUDIX domain-containing protein [Saprospiraceae bacterium]
MPVKKEIKGYRDLNNFSVALSVDCVVFGYDDEDKDLKILLIRSETQEYRDQWSLLGDLVLPQEDLNDAAVRILKKRTGLENVYLEQVETFGRPNRHPRGRVVTIAYYSLIRIKDYSLNVEKLDLEARWHSIQDIRKLAFDHNEILNTCYERLKKGLQERPVGFSMLPKKFSLRQLQNLYEVVLKIEVDRRNFRRKLRSHDVLVELPEIQKGVTHRPAKLYAFDNSKYEQLLKAGKTFNIP